MSRSDLSGLKEASWLGFTFEPDVSAKKGCGKNKGCIWHTCKGKIYVFMSKNDG